MSRDVEQRVVEMRFDNAQFERGISQSKASLEAFNKSLGDLGGSTKGIGAFTASLKAISFDPINNGIQIGIGKLSALTAALTGVSNIADTVYKKVTDTVRALSGIDNVTAGFEKYTSATESVQTMMAATRKEGESLAEAMERCNQALSDVLWFSDETSYSSQQMTQAIGQFASAGVQLDDAKQAIQGIALWAATAGVNTKKAQGAFYNLSQAMSSGYLENKDWMSLDLLGFTSFKSKQVILETAEAMGKLRKEGEKYYTELGTEVTAEGMRGTLSEKWFDKELMVEVFKKYSLVVPKIKKLSQDLNISATEAISQLKAQGLTAEEEFSLAAFEMGQEAKTLEEALDSIKDAASSKFQEIFQIIFGDYIEAKQLFSDLAEGLYKIFVDPLWLVAEAFSDWKLEKGRQKALTSIYNIIRNIYSVFEKFKAIWEEVWGTKYDKTKRILDAITKGLIKLSSWIYNLSSSILKNQKIIDNFTAFAEGTKNIIDALKKVVVDLFNEISSRFNSSGGPEKIIEAISNIFGWIGNLLTKLSELINEGKVAEKIFNAFEKVASKLKGTFELLGNTFKRIFEFKKDRNIIWQLGTAAVEFKSPLEIIRDILVTIIDLTGKIIAQLTPMVASVWSFIKAVIYFLGNIVTNIGPLVEKAFGMLTAGVTDATNKITEYLNSADFSNPFEAILGAIKKIAESIGGFVKIIIDAIIKVKDANASKRGDSKSFLEKMGIGIANFAETLYSHREAIEWMQATLFGNQDMITVMLNIATALVKLFSTIAAGIIVVYGVIEIITWIKNVLSNGQGGLFSKITSIMSGLQSMYANFSNIVAKFGNAKMISSFAALMWSIAGSLFIISLIPTKELVKSAITLGIFVAILSVVLTSLIKLINKFDESMRYEIYGLNEKNILSQSQGKHSSSIGMLAALIISIGAAMLMMASSIAIIASCANWDSAAIGFSGLVLIIASVAGVLWTIKQLKFKKKDTAVIGMISLLFIAIGKAMTYIAKAIAAIGEIDRDNIFNASLALSYMLAAVVTVMLYISAFKPKASTLKAAGSMFFEIGLLFLGVAYAMKIVSKIDNFANAVPAIAILVTIVSALVMLTTTAAKAVEKIKHGTQVASLAMVGVMMANMVAVIVAIAGAVLAIGLSLKDPELIESATAAVIELIATVGLMLLLVQMLTGNSSASGKQMVTFAASLMLMGLAVLSFVPALLALKDISSDAIWKVIGALAGLVTIVLGISFVLGQFENVSAGLEQFTMTLVWLSGATLISSVGIMMMALSIEKVINAFAKFVDLGPSASEQIKSVMTAFSEGLVEIFRAIGIGFVEMMQTINNNRRTIIKYIRLLVGAVVTGLFGALPDFLDYIKEVLAKVLEILWAIGPDLIFFITQTTEQLIGAILDTVITMGPKLNDAVTTLVESALLDILGMIKNVIPQLNNTLNLVLVNVTYELLDNIHTMTNMILNALSNLADELLIGLPIVTMKITAIGVAIIVAFIAGLIKGLYESLPMFIDETAKSFVKLVNGLCKTIEEQAEPVYEAICKMITTALTAVAEWAGRMTYDMYSDGPFGPIKKTCAYLTEGFVRGFQDEKNKAKIAKAGQEIATVLNDGYRDVQEMHSPSKLWESFGGFTVDGLVNGVKSSLGNVKNVGIELASTLNGTITTSFSGLTEKMKFLGSKLFSSFGNGAKDSFTSLFAGSNLLSGFSSNTMFDGMLNLNPTITPSLDLSQIKSGASNLDSLFDGKQIKAISDITDWSKSQTSSMEELKMQNSLDTKEQIKELSNLVTKYMNIQQYNSEQPTNVNVTLEGDASKMLKILKIEDNKLSKATGISMYNKGKNAIDNIIKVGGQF